MTNNILFFLSLTFFCFTTAAQSIDVQHYRFELELSDRSDTLKGKATVTVTFLEETNKLQLNLQSVHYGKGMIGYRALEYGIDQTVKHRNDTLTVFLTQPVRQNETRTYEIVYAGIPADGLIISKNKWGDRTFFADNWPTRARHWLPCHDVPSDKASVEFIVTAPAYYQVVSNGMQLEETVLDKNSKRTHWREDTPLPTKVMVIGAARFAVGRMDSSATVPVTAWVYPQDRQKGFYDYALTVPILHFFSDYIGPYPFRKLANVQSKTIFGGMENASAIFYSEETVTGDRTAEDLWAHEIAHQWFGDMVTEKNFAHLWLSEGFATYMTGIYLEQKYGRDSMQRRLQQERAKVVQFTRTSNRPVVDSITPLLDLLNENSYQKGAWVLHMLRTEVGDTLFQKIIRTYYQQYKGSNAVTADFQAVVEEVTKRDWKTFFQQWLFQPGIPKLSVYWQYQNNQIVLKIEQKSRNQFSFPLQIAFVDAAGRLVIKEVQIKNKTINYSFPSSSKPVNIVLDPHTLLLFEGIVMEVR